MFCKKIQDVLVTASFIHQFVHDQDALGPEAYPMFSWFSFLVCVHDVTTLFMAQFFWVIDRMRMLHHSKVLTKGLLSLRIPTGCTSMQSVPS